MSDLSSSREQTVLENIRSGGVYVSLHSTDEGNEPTGTSEVGASDYAREFVAATDLSISGSGPTELTNDLDIDWGVTDNDWGTVSHAALWDDAASGTDPTPYTSTMALSNGGDAPSGIQVKINAGGLTFTID